MEPAASATDPALAHFAGIVLAAALGGIQGRSERLGPLRMILIRLPGTLLHELAHLAVAFIIGGRPVGFTVIPRRTVALGADGTPRRVWLLGAVTIANPSALAALPSALAPLLLLPVAWFLYRSWFCWFPPDVLHTLMMYVAVVVCSGSALPSGQDLRVAFSRPLGVALYTLLGAGAWYAWRGL